ncbi:MAG: hypothetical protein EAZ97_12295 [Bacteroidetes bacterium]|nr:MAG: hypothetical protein EAZ97_12295 [Bacteroidota bacterium]
MFQINKISVVFAFSLLFLTSSCLPEQDLKTSKKFFDLKKVISKQIDWLTKSNAKVRKNAQIGGDRKEETLAVDWASELKVFVDSDINAPIFQDSYLVSQNANSLIYKALQKNLKVRELHIISQENCTNFSDLEEKLSEIKIVYRDENSFYFTKRNLAMQFKQGKVETYQVIGFQKIMFKDTLDYQVASEVLK